MSNIEFNKDELQYKPVSARAQEAALEFKEDLKQTPVVGDVIKFNEEVGAIYTKYFGYVAPPFPLLGFDPLAKVPLRNIKSLFKGKGNFAPIRMPLEVSKPNGATGKWLMFPNMPMVSVKGSKNVVFTEILRGVDKKGNSQIGTVKEETYQRDWQIDISGIIIGENEDEFPTDEMAFMHNICEYGHALRVRHVLLNALDINYIKIIDFDIPTVEGEGENVQTFIIKAMSDEDFESELLGT